MSPLVLSLDSGTDTQPQPEHVELLTGSYGTKRNTARPQRSGLTLRALMSMKTWRPLEPTPTGPLPEAWRRTLRWWWWTLWARWLYLQEEEAQVFLHYSTSVFRHNTTSDIWWVHLSRTPPNETWSVVRTGRMVSLKVSESGHTHIHPSTSIQPTTTDQNPDFMLYFDQW